MGRNVKVKLEDDNMTLVEIIPYKIEELIYDIQTGEKIDTETLKVVSRIDVGEGPRAFGKFLN